MTTPGHTRRDYTCHVGLVVHVGKLGQTIVEDGGRRLGSTQHLTPGGIPREDAADDRTPSIPKALSTCLSPHAVGDIPPSLGRVVEAVGVVKRGYEEDLGRVRGGVRVQGRVACAQPV